MAAVLPLTRTIELTAAGSSGSATGSGSAEVSGVVYAMRVEFESDQPDTARVVVTDTFLGQEVANILKDDLSGDSITLYPRFLENEADGTPLTTTTMHFVSSRSLSIALSGGNADSTRAVTVKLQMAGAEYGA